MRARPLALLLAAGLAVAGLAAAGGAAVTEERPIVFGRGDSIWLAAPDGSGLRRLTRGARDGAPAWSPDGRWVAFDSDRAGKQEVWVVGRDGTGLRRVTRAFPGQAFTPTWSPDGRRIAYATTRAGIAVAGADGSGERVLTTGLDDSQPSWSPAGDRIAFVRRQRIYVVSASGGKPRPLLPKPADRRWAGDSWPDWSPDGRRLVFVRSALVHPEDMVGVGSLTLVSAGGGGLRRVGAKSSPYDVDEHPRWSPDGKRIVFQGTRGGTPGLFVVGAGGSGLRRVTRDGSDSWPDW